MSASLEEIASFLDEYLRVREVPDYGGAVNGLQVENSGTVSRVVAAVDASLESARAAGQSGESGPALLLVHHGLFWDGVSPIAGPKYFRIKSLISHDTALYSAHIPLDCHPEVGNNVQLARAIGLDSQGWFGDYQGIDLGVYGALEMEREALVNLLAQKLDTSVRLMPGGPSKTARVGVITGGAGSMIADAKAVGVDTFVTGEGSHHTYFDAMEGGINVIYAGHYATEQLGVQAVARLVSERFEIPWSYFHHPTGL